MSSAASKIFAGTGGIGGSVWPSWSTAPRLGTDGMLRAYDTMPWLRSFLQKISEDVAGLTWHVYVPTLDPGTSLQPGKAFRDKRLQRASSKVRAELMSQYIKAGKLRELPNHPVIDLLTAGNEYFPGLVSMQLAQTHLDLVGETSWLLELNQYRMPVKALPIPPTWITALPASTGGFYRIVGPGGTWDVPKPNMFWAYHPSPANPFSRGTGIAQVLADELETDEYAAKYIKDFFRNRAVPPVLIAGLGLGLSELQRVEEKWLSKFQRVGAGWMPAFLGAKVDVHQLSPSFEQQQFGEIRKQQRDNILQTLGIPPEIAGVIENSNRSTIESADFIYQSRVIVPRAEFLRAQMQETLMPLFDERLVIDYVNPVQEDREFILKVWQAKPEAFDLDEWRGFAGREPLPNNRGKVHMVPFNLTPVTSFTAEAFNPKPDPGTPQPEPDSALPPAATTSGDAVPPKRLKGRVAKVSRAREKADGPDPHEIANAADAQVIIRAGRPVIRSVIGHFGQQVLTDAAIENPFDLSDPNVINHMRSWGADRVTGMINESTKEDIANAIADGLEEGETFDDISDRITEVFDLADEFRADLIATTEITRSSNFGALEGMSQAGFEEKEWLSTQDDRVRNTESASHVEMDGQVQAVDDDFESETSGNSGPYPGEMGGPEDDCNCRCTVITPLARGGGDEAGGELAGMLRKSRWKALDAERMAYVRLLKTKLGSAFRTQERAVKAELRRQMSKGLPEIHITVEAPKAPKQLTAGRVTQTVERDERGLIAKIHTDKDEAV